MIKKPGHGPTLTKREKPLNSSKKIVLIGPPGCGKGTQASRIRETFSIPHISSGNILRDEVRRGTDFGRQIKEFMDRGEIGPVELITEVIMNYLGENCPSGFLFDGFPRALYQAEKLKERHNIDAAILISVPDEDIIKRITGRRTCTACSEIFHVEYNPPVKPHICDRCGAPLILRDDDNRETVQNRLSVYRNQTMPVIEFYKKEGLLREVDGAKEPAAVFQDIMKLFS
jgi:adenylate kinase